mgnify:CR=1 FL=1
MLASFARWIAVVTLILPMAAAAHEVLPSIADMEARDGVLAFDVRANLEGFVAGIDLTVTADTNAAPQAMEMIRAPVRRVPKITRAASVLQTGVR